MKKKIKYIVKPIKRKYNELLLHIGTTLEEARSGTISFLNQQMLNCYWKIGKHIVQYEQQGEEKAEYGSALLTNLSKDLQLRFGKGFGRSNLYMMRQFYLLYPIFQTSGKSLKKKSLKFQTSGKLTWSHYCELLAVSDNVARSFYERQAVQENWSFRELKRQIDSPLFQRLSLSKNKKGLLSLAAKGHKVFTTEDLIKDPYVFEFLKIPGDKKITEKNLEKKLINNLQHFLLELGKGYSFIARQFKITLDNQHFYIDLVF